MIAKQTLVSASLLALIVAATVPARAEPGAPPERPDEAPFDDPTEPPVGPRAKTGTFQIGAGYRTDDGFIASARVAQTNLFGTGTKLALDATISARQQRFVAAFQDPTLFGSGVALDASLYSEWKRLPGFTRKVAGGSLGLSTELAPHVRGFVGLRAETIEAVPDREVSARGSLGDPFRGGRLVALRAGLEYNTLDNPIWPRRGTRVGTSIEVADRDLGSEIQMFRTDSWLSHHRPIGPLTLHLGGTLSTVTDGAPFSERLHFEGSRDVRGKAPGAIGPFDPVSGASLGGTLKYTGRGELELPVSRRLGLSVVGFADIGGIAASPGHWTTASAGFGIAWNSPIGLLRFDWAVPLDGGKPVFVFGLGGSW